MRIRCANYSTSNCLETKLSENEGIFHLTSARDFYCCLDIALQRYQKARSKRIEDIFFLVMGANHLREWIAPGYDPEFKNKIPIPPPKTAEQKFYLVLFEDKDFKIVKKLCNRAKHLKPRHREPSYSYSNSSDLCIDDWDCMIDDVPNWDEGPPAGFFVDGEEVGAILHRLLNKYRDDWFEHQQSTDLTT